MRHQNKTKYVLFLVSVFLICSLLLAQSPISLATTETFSENASEETPPSRSVTGLTPGKVYYWFIATGVLRAGGINSIVKGSLSSATTDGKNLWGLKYLPNGYYKLVSLGNKIDTMANFSIFTNNYVLSATSNATLCLAVDVTNPYDTSTASYQQQWSLQYDTTHGGYTLKNRYCSSQGLTNQWLAFNYPPNFAGASPCLASSSSTLRYWSATQVVQTGYRSTSTYSTPVGNVKSIKIHADSSLYENNIISAEMMSCVTAWDNISPNINIYGLGETAPSDAVHVYFYGASVYDALPNEPMFPQDDFGVTIPRLEEDENNPHYYNLNYFPTTDWHHVDIYINTNTGADLSTANASTKRKVLLHELGHALMLKHPADSGYPNSSSVVSIMNQGSYLSDSDCMVTRYPAFLDRVNLNNRWS